MDTADLAIAISMVSLAGAALSVGWTVMSHYLVGARIKLSLTRGIVTHMSALATSYKATWTSDHMPRQMMLDQGLWEDVTVVEIANIGRAPLTVSSIGLSIKTEKRGLRRHKTGTTTWSFPGVVEITERHGGRRPTAKFLTGVLGLGFST